MWQEVLSHLAQLGPNGEMERRGRKEQKKKEGKKKESFRERDATFSLDFPEIEQAVSGGANVRVHPHCKGFP